MAFYADVYGFIARKEADGISRDLVEAVRNSSPIFKPCFSVPVPTKKAHYISFACGVKLDVGEDDLWLSAFEEVLKQINFLNASVNIVHEETGNIMMYSYIKDGGIQRFSSKLEERFIGESLIPLTNGNVGG